MKSKNLETFYSGLSPMQQSDFEKIMAQTTGISRTRNPDNRSFDQLYGAPSFDVMNAHRMSAALWSRVNPAYIPKKTEISCSMAAYVDQTADQEPASWESHMKKSDINVYANVYFKPGQRMICRGVKVPGPYSLSSWP